MITFFLIFAFSTLYAAKPIEISDIKNPVNILKDTDIYIDKENKHNFDFILENSKKIFKKNKNKFLHLGYTSDAVWLKFTIKNSSKSTIKKVLEISNQMLDEITLFSKEINSSKYIKKSKGIHSNLALNEDILHIYFNISLKPNETKIYYLKVSSLSCAVYFELDLMSKDQLYQKEIKYQLFLTLFFGSIITLIIYNLFIFYFTKDLAYLYYVMYLFFTILEHASYTTLNFYIFSKDFLDKDIFLAIFYISNISIFSILFIREYLNIKIYKKIDYVFKFFIVLNIFFLLFHTPSFYPLDIVVFFDMILLIYIIAVSFYLLYKGEKNAKYMIIGWSISIFGWMMQGMYNFGAWSLLYKYPYIFEISIFSEAIIFSVALASRLNMIEKLEKSIKTNEVLTKELYHRVKNNMQLIISMYRFKLSKYSNSNISKSLNEVERTIQTMSRTYEMMYSHKESADVTTKSYFNTLINRLKENYFNMKVDIVLEISTSLDTEKSIYIGVILNELITNSFKYAFENDEGKITITFLKVDKRYVLIVEDNGKGFDITKQRKTFGLELVQTLVEDELQGKLEINTVNKSKYVISWF